MSIKVLIAEDSAFQRKVISDMLSDQQEIQTVDVARNGKEALKKIEICKPDVLLLDLLMPEMDGLTAFKYIMETNPIPTIIFSVLDPKTLDKPIQALLLGAFDYILKPGGIWKVELPKFKDQIISKVMLASKSKIKKKSVKRPNEEENRTLHYNNGKKGEISDSRIVVIGTSTGGPSTLRTVLKDIPKDYPIPILIVQHLDAFFMEQLAKSLNDICALKVKVAEEGELLRGGCIYFAPGGYHMEIAEIEGISCIHVFEGNPVNYCIPSVDVLFFSAARIFKNRTLGIILTGLGADGAAGLAAIKMNGGQTIAESQDTAVVYGMPKSAIERDAANLIVSNYDIKNCIINFADKFRS